MIPSGYKAGKTYSIIPDDGSGDFTAARTTVANRNNEDALLEQMAIDVPRLQYPSCPSVLLEPASTNNVLYPISIDNAYWTKSGSSIDNSGFSSPSVDYPLDAVKLVEDTSTSNHRFYKTSIAVSSGSKVTMSIYVKPNGRDWVLLRESVTNSGLYFDVKNGVIGSPYSATPVDDYSIEAIVDGWYRVSITTTAPATTTAFHIRLANADSSATYQGDGVSGMLLYGAQVEEHTYITSFIYDGTEGATTTRTADTLSGATYAGLSEQGTFFAQIAALANDGTVRALSLSDGTTSNKVTIQYDVTANVIYAAVVVGGSTVANLSYAVADVTAMHKIAVAWKLNDMELWVDGLLRDIDQTAITFGAGILTTISFDDGAGGSPLYGEVQQMGTFTELTEAEKTTLTT